MARIILVLELSGPRDAESRRQDQAAARFRFHHTAQTLVQLNGGVLGSLCRVCQRC